MFTGHGKRWYAAIVVACVCVSGAWAAHATKTFGKDEGRDAYTVVVWAPNDVVGFLWHGTWEDDETGEEIPFNECEQFGGWRPACDDPDHLVHYPYGATVCPEHFHVTKDPQFPTTELTLTDPDLGQHVTFPSVTESQVTTYWDGYVLSPFFVDGAGVEWDGDPVVCTRSRWSGSDLATNCYGFALMRSGCGDFFDAVLADGEQGEDYAGIDHPLAAYYTSGVAAFQTLCLMKTYGHASVVEKCSIYQRELYGLPFTDRRINTIKFKYSQGPYYMFAYSGEGRWQGNTFGLAGTVPTYYAKD